MTVRFHWTRWPTIYRKPLGNSCPDRHDTEVKTSPRTKPEPVKQPIVEDRGFKDISLFKESVAEMSYQPAACRQAYRLIAVRKDLIVSEPRQGRLFDDYRYFFSITNDANLTAEEVVFSANDRCQQENILAQLNAVRSLHAPVDNLTLYADDIAGVEPQGLVGAAASREQGTLASATPGSTNETLANGVPDVCQLLASYPVPSSHHRPPIDNANHGLESLATCLLPFGRRPLASITSITTCLLGSYGRQPNKYPQRLCSRSSPSLTYMERKTSTCSHHRH